MKTAYVYILASSTRTTYTGVTSNLERRVWEHKAHFREGFTKRYNVTRLVYVAEFEGMDDAIAWEKALKGKSRAKKAGLIEAQNPRWNDLAWNWYGDDVLGAETMASPPSAPHGDSSLRSE
jgi:putative endonuclease